MGYEANGVASIVQNVFSSYIGCFTPRTVGPENYSAHIMRHKALFRRCQVPQKHGPSPLEEQEGRENDLLWDRLHHIRGHWIHGSRGCQCDWSNWYSDDLSISLRLEQMA